MAILVNGVKVAGVGVPGKDATINGYNAIKIEQGQNIIITDDGNGTFTVSADAAAVKLVRW